MTYSSAKVTRGLLAILIIPAFLAVAPHPVLGQQPDGPPLAKAPTVPRPAPKAPGAEGSASGEAGLRRRVEQLEEQLVDMQVVIGTLESLARSAPAAGTSPRGGTGGGFTPSDSARVDGLETQIRALTTQIEQVAGEVRALGGNPQRRIEAVPDARLAPQAGSLTEPPGASATEQFGSTTITPERGDPIGGLLSRDGAAGNPPSGEAPPTAALERGTPPLPDGAAGNPKQLYETAYGYLLQQNYKAAETAFDEFLKRYPNDSLSGNAQYWLGESHFVRGEYKAAAGAFLKGYETYASSTKAPDSLLKLAMSLDRLGQKDAACSSYSELATKFPNAAPHVKSRAQTERQRVGCP